MVLSEKDLAIMRARALADTGFFARNILKFNFDKNEETTEILNRGEGGVRPYGPHQDMIAFLDDESTRFKHLLAPRGSYKTSILRAYAMRRVLQNPNLRVIYGMDIYGNALKKLGSIKRAFERNQALRQLFGNRCGSPWSASGFTIKGSTYSAFDDNPSFSGYGSDKSIIGGHCDVIILDDFVTFENTRNEAQVKKTLDAFEMLFPILDGGGTFIVVGTRYLDNDLHAHIENSLSDLFARMYLGSGVDIERNEEGTPYLTGTPVFPHQDMDFLKRKFEGMKDPGKFSKQYNNICISSAEQLFHRRDFNPVHWEDWMKDLSCYILTDTATSDKEENCQSVIALVGLDATDNAYLLGLEVGHWVPDMFGKKFADFVEKWQSKVMIRGATFEEIGLNAAMEAIVKAHMRERNLTCHIISIKRKRDADAKKQRIKGLQNRFNSGRFFVVTKNDRLDVGVDRYFNDLGTQKILFDPEAKVTGSDLPLPDGELVKQFIRLGSYGMMDIADALADMDYSYKGVRYVQPMALSAKYRIMQEEIMRGRRQALPTRMVLNGKAEFVNLVPTSSSRGGSWHSNKAKKLRLRPY